MTPDLNIDLTGIPEERWTEREERCAVCRNYFLEEEEDNGSDENGVGSVPLLLWRKDGEEMLRLCWFCAKKRIKPGLPY